MGRLNFLTCCLEARHGKPVKSSDEAYTVLKNYQMGIYTLLIIQVLVDVLWITMAYVNGFALYTVDPSVVVSTGWAHAVSHLGLWFILEFLSAWLGAQVTWFSLETRPEKSYAAALRFLIVYLIALGTSMVADIVHIVLTGLEVGDDESTFAVENWGFLIAFLVVYILYLVFIKAWLFYRSVVYYRAIQEYTGADLVMNLIPSAMTMKANDLENAGASTPMMQEYYNRKRSNPPKK